MNENSTPTTVVRLQSTPNGGIAPSALAQNTNIPTPVTIAPSDNGSNVLFANFNNSTTIENKTTEINFKGESLQQLSTNSLPPYVPDSPPNILKSDSTFRHYCCTDCGDAFLIKDSLTFHLERRSVLIKFPCEACKNVQIFYNRCTLLSHIRAHADKNETADISKGVVYPLPRVFMDGLQTELSNSPEAIDDANQTPASDLLEFSLKEMEIGNEESERTTAVEENENVVKVKCLDCNEEFDSPEARAQHLTQNDKMPVTINTCNKCNMVCPSKCFLKAHQRIHLQISPYVCPECGESPSPLWQNFQFHVKFKCFHNARCLGYKCPLCKRLSISNDSLLKHMELHTDKFLKCGNCIRAFTNPTTFNTHVEIDHPNVKEKPRYTIIFKCALCDIVFLNKAQMLGHRSTHLKEQLCEYVFNCMQCGKPLESKNQLSEHIKNAHPKIHKTLIGNYQTSNTTEAEFTYRGNVECLLCSSNFHSYQGYRVHLAKNHTILNQPCTYCYMVLPNRQRMVEHGKKHLNKGSYLCLLCNNKRWHDAKQLDSHLSKHVNKLQHCSFCPICNAIMKTSTDATHHLREEHMLFELMDTQPKGVASKIMSRAVKFTCHFCRRSYENDSELQHHLQTNHNFDDLKSIDSVENEDNPSEPSAKKVRVEGNVCAKCSYHSVEREDFKKHIISHKINKSTLQCQECGLCFVVEPALEKHLRIVHKITDTKQYIQTEGTNCMPDFESHAEVSTCNSLLCSVCFNTFPNETALKTHMRSHGMAFIHKLQNPLPPET